MQENFDSKVMDYGLWEKVKSKKSKVESEKFFSNLL